LDWPLAGLSRLRPDPALGLEPDQGPTDLVSNRHLAKACSHGAVLGLGSLQANV
jgi:hypothetical protein